MGRKHETRDKPKLRPAKCKPNISRFDVLKAISTPLKHIVMNFTINDDDVIIKQTLNDKIFTQEITFPNYSVNHIHADDMKKLINTFLVRFKVNLICNTVHMHDGITAHYSLP